MPYTIGCVSDEWNEAMDVASSNLSQPDFFCKEEIPALPNPNEDSLLGQKRSYSQFSMCDEVLTLNR